jgi:hypothetical protein
MMEDSGLEDLWSQVYARNSLRKMMEGKSYTKTLRACLMTDAALHILLFQNFFHGQQDNNMSQTDDTDDDIFDSAMSIEDDDEELNDYFFEENLPSVALEEIVANFDSEEVLVPDSDVPGFVSEEVIWNENEFNTDVSEFDVPGFESEEVLWNENEFITGSQNLTGNYLKRLHNPEKNICNCIDIKFIRYFLSLNMPNSDNFKFSSIFSISMATQQQQQQPVLRPLSK